MNVKKGLSKRYEVDGKRLAEYTRDFKEVPFGTDVAVQNQNGKNAKKWDKTGKVVATAVYNNLYIKMDGSNRLTTRNRRYVKPIVPVTSPKIKVSDSESLVDVEENDYSSSPDPESTPVFESASNEGDVVSPMVYTDKNDNLVWFLLLWGKKVQ